MSDWKSICSASSRACRRLPDLAAIRGPACELAFEGNHFDCSDGGFPSLIAALQASAVDGLFEVLAGQHSIRMRHSGLLRGLSNAARNFSGNVFVVRSLTADETTERDDSIHGSRLGKKTCR